MTVYKVVLNWHLPATQYMPMIQANRPMYFITHLVDHPKCQHWSVVLNVDQNQMDLAQLHFLMGDQATSMSLGDVLTLYHGPTAVAEVRVIAELMDT